MTWGPAGGAGAVRPRESSGPASAAPGDATPSTGGDGGGDAGDGSTGAAGGDGYGRRNAGASTRAACPTAVDDAASAAWPSGIAASPWPPSRLPSTSSRTRRRRTVRRHFRFARRRRRRHHRPTRTRRHRRRRRNPPRGRIICERKQKCI